MAGSIVDRQALIDVLSELPSDDGLCSDCNGSGYLATGYCGRCDGGRVEQRPWGSYGLPLAQFVDAILTTLSAAEPVAWDHSTHGPHTLLSHDDQRYAGCRAGECEPLYRKVQG